MLSFSDILLDLHNSGMCVMAQETWYGIKIFSMFVTTFLIYVVLRYFTMIIFAGKLGKATISVIAVYFVVVTAGFVTTPFTGFIMSLENGVFTRGPLYLVPYYVGLVGLALIVAIAVMYKSRLNVSRLLIILGCVLIMLFGGIWHVFFAEVFGVRLFSYCYMLVAMLLYTSLQDPYEYYYKHNLCFNEKCFLDIIEDRFASGKKFSVFFLGIDNMELVMQTLSPQEIEELESRMILMLQKVCRKKNVFIVGELSFAIITPGDIREMVVRVSNQMDKICFDMDIKRAISPFIYAFRSDAFETFDHIYKALSYFKDRRDRTGVNESIEYLTTDRFDCYDREIKVYSALVRAMKNDSFLVYFQPIFNSENSNFACAEALLRVPDKELGLLYPSEFIPIAERNGLIVKLGELVFNRVCSIVAKFNLHSLGMDYIDINISALQCMQPDFADRMKNILTKYHLAPGSINFEIADDACLIEDNTVMTDNFKKLIEYGMSLTIDNFGTAAAGAEKILKFPVRYVKFDRSVIWNSLLNDKCRIVTDNMVKMIKSLGVKCVACGIETDNLLDVIREMQFGFYQGYYFAKPIPEDEFISFLTSRLS